jgi:hypothetical protein
VRCKVLGERFEFLSSSCSRILSTMDINGRNRINGPNTAEINDMVFFACSYNVHVVPSFASIPEGSEKRLLSIDSVPFNRSQPQIKLPTHEVYGHQDGSRGHTLSEYRAKTYHISSPINTSIIPTVGNRYVKICHSLLRRSALHHHPHLHQYRRPALLCLQNIGRQHHHPASASPG